MEKTTLNSVMCSAVGKTGLLRLCKPMFAFRVCEGRVAIRGEEDGPVGVWEQKWIRWMSEYESG